MTTQFDPERSDRIRALLIEDAATSARLRLRPGLTTALLLAGALAGAGVSTAAFAAIGGIGSPVIAQPSGQPQPDLPGAVDPPPGTTPGAPLISLIGGPTALTATAPLVHPMTDRPEGVTHVRVTITPLTAGSVNWGTDPGGNNPSASFAADDLGGTGNTTWYDFPLDDSTDEFFLTPTGGFTASVSFQYLNQTPTHLKRNAAGQTYGVEGGPDGAPDLVFVSGISPEGTGTLGYDRSDDLNATSPEHPGLPTSPEEAIKWQKEREKKYPNGWDIPVYESDGTTQIGTFHIG